MSKKEYYLHHETAYGDVFSEKKVNLTDTRVIEYSAYEQLKFDLEATEKVYQMNRQYVEDSKLKIRQLEDEIDELRSIAYPIGSI